MNLRYGLRSLFKNPAFALIAVATLAIGIGSCTAIFSIVDAVMVHPLHYRQADRLVLVTKNMPMFSLVKSDASALDFVDYRSGSRSFSGMAALSLNSVNLTGSGEPVRVFGLRVSANLFSLLGVTPLLGRDFRAEDEQPGHDRVALLGVGLWRSHFGSDPEIAGKTIEVNGEKYIVLGVVEPVLQFLETSEIYVPLALTAEALHPDQRGHQNMDVIARLRPEVSLEQARAEMKVVAAHMTRHLPDWYPQGWSIDVDPLADSVAGELRAPLLVLFTAVGVVLLIACVNVSNLLLAKATTREREIGIRAALGASRGDIIGQLLTESLVLAALAGGAGFCLAVWLLDFLRRFGPTELLRSQSPEINAWVAIFTIGLSVAASLISGLAPAISASKADLNHALKDQGRGSTSGAAGKRLRGLLVVSEVALSLTLLVSAGLLVRSFWRLQHTSPGFRTDHVLTARLTLPVGEYREPARINAFYSQLLASVSRSPEVVAAGVGSGLPFGAGSGGGSFQIAGRPWPSGRAVPDVGRRIVSPGYLRALGVPLLKGRFFEDSDAAGAPNVALIDETLAKTYFPKGDALGQRLSGPLSGHYEIVGIVGGVKDRSLIGPPSPIIYYPAWQAASAYMTLVVRTTGDPLQQVAGIQTLVHGLDPKLPVYRVATMEELLSNWLLRRRFAMLLLACLAGIALLLAAIGIYGVINYTVSRRIPEIGVRIALGASRTDLQALILGQAMRPVLGGVALGLGLAFAAAQALATLLYEVNAADPVTYAGVSAMLIGVSLLAAYLPVRRALRVDPMIALRHE